jgi:putative transposase
MNASHRLEAGAPVLWLGHSAVVLEAPEIGTDATIRVTGEQAIRVVPGKELTPLKTLHSLEQTQPLQIIDEMQWERAALRARYCELIESRVNKVVSVEMAASALNVSPRTVWRQLKRYRMACNTSALVDRRRGVRAGARYLPVQQEAIIQDCIESGYLTRERPHLSDTVEKIRLLCQQKGIAPPSAKAVRARLAAIDPRYVMRRRHGHKRAKEAFAPVPGLYSAERPMECVQIDHTLADIILVSDDAARTVLGRPYLTLAIDVATRCIVGFHVTFDPPSSVTVALCILSIVLPKNALATYIGVDLHGVDWPCSGDIGALHLDNAQEFHSKGLERGCQEHHINIQYRPVGSPHWGGIVERLMGTFMGRLRLLPGATQRNVSARDKQDVEKRACLTLREFRQWLVTEITTHYHHRKHRTLGMTPIDAWQKYAAEGFVDCSHVLSEAECARLFVDFLPYEERKIRRDGIELHGLRYWHADMAPYVKDGVDHFIRYDPRDITRVYVIDPIGRVITVKCTKEELPAISLNEWRELRKKTTGLPEALESLSIRHGGLQANADIVALSAREKRKARRGVQRREESRQATEALPIPSNGDIPMRIATDFDPTLPLSPFNILEL